MRRAPFAISTTVALALLLPSSVPARADGLREQARALFGVIEAPTEREIADPVAALGRALFWDTRLSADGATACASCHAAASPRVGNPLSNHT